MLIATRAEKVLDSMFTIFDQSIRQGMAASLQGQTPNAEQQRILDAMPGQLAQVFREEMTWAKLRPIYVRVYQETFTQEEVNAITAFYKTPAGAASIDKMPVVMQKSMTESQALMGPMVERFKAIQQQVAADIQAAK
ncbi:MAG: DUF2059 domain-containing protein [Pseudomonadota bacterium]